MFVLYFFLLLSISFDILGHFACYSMNIKQYKYFQAFNVECRNNYKIFISCQQNMYSLRVGLPLL